MPAFVGYPIVPVFPIGAGWAPILMLSPPQFEPGIPRPPFGDPPVPSKVVPRPRPTDPALAARLVKMGDNLFRAGNLNRAQERYEQAVRADFSDAAPRMRLAQVAMVRARYSEAADHLREAQAADPHWLDHPRDVQTLFGDPSDFAAQVGRLETHLQAHPEDRDAWLMLGINRLLTGQSREASDIFLRISGDHPDPALSAFLDASTRRVP